MSDISKCLNVSCPFKEGCYRYTAMDNSLWQAYSSFSVDLNTGECKDFWNNGRLKRSEIKQIIKNGKKD